MRARTRNKRRERLDNGIESRASGFENIFNAKDSSSDNTSHNYFDAFDSNSELFSLSEEPVIDKESPMRFNVSQVIINENIVLYANIIIAIKTMCISILF